MAPIPSLGSLLRAGLGYNLFRHGNQFYVYQDGRWYRGKHLNGPWKSVKKPPKALTAVGPAYFKPSPGQGQANKTGWRGEPLPPGQMKKLERGGSLPPGQMKKLQ